VPAKSSFDCWSSITRCRIIRGILFLRV
jgi:hypothetical protein